MTAQGRPDGSPAELVVGIDLATAEVRAVAADARGRLHGTGRAALPPPVSRRPNWCEQDATSWWPAVVSSLGRMGRQIDPRSRVLALSVCATSGTVVALDSSGEPTGPALMYSDQRATGEAATAQSAAAARWAALGLRVQPSFGLAKWGWLVRHGGASRLAHASDVVVARLLGRPPPTDWSHALKSGYDPLRRQWVEDALASLAISAGLLPEVLAPTTSVGRLSEKAAAETGLPRECEIRLGMTDACASQLAAGAGTPGRFVSVLGTTLVLKGVSHDLVVDPAGAVYSHRHPAGWWLPGGASSTGGAALTAAFAGRDLARLDELAERHGPAGTVAYPLVGRGERFPFVAPDAEGFVLGEPPDDVARYRSLLEGVAFVERLGYEHLAHIGAPAEGPIAASGSASASRTWNRIRATVLGMPVMAKPGAGTALGACILAAAGTLHADLVAATGAMSPSGEEVAPDPAEAEALEASYRRFCAELAHRGWWRSPV